MASGCRQPALPRPAGGSRRYMTPADPGNALGLLFRTGDHRRVSSRKRCPTPFGRSPPLHSRIVPHTMISIHSGNRIVNDASLVSLIVSARRRSRSLRPASCEPTEPP